MARPRRWAEQDMIEALRGQAARGLTPEMAAAELGVSVSQLRRYLDGVGGSIVTNRMVRMPEAPEVKEGNENREAGGAGERTVGPARP